MKKILTMFLVLSTISLAETWKTTIDKVKVTNELKKIDKVKIYSGDTVEKEIFQKAPKNKKYVIVSLKVDKLDTSKEMFDSYELYLVTKSKKYERMENDDFLEKFNISVFPHVRIKLGTHTGELVYLINSNDTLEGAYLEYNGNKINLENIKVM